VTLHEVPPGACLGMRKLILDRNTDYGLRDSESSLIYVCELGVILEKPEKSVGV
jgi:hypothetical protein